MDTPISEPVSPGIAPAAGDGVSPPVVPDSVPVVATSPGSAPLSLILGGFLALLLSAWAGIAPFIGPSFGFSPDGTASWTWNLVHGLGAVLPGAVGLLACLGIVVIARRLTGTLDARRQLLPCRVAVFDPGLLDGTCDRARCSARRFWCIRDGACWTGVTRELVKNILPWPCGSACDGTGLSPSVTTRGDNPLSVCRARTLPMGRLGTSLMRLCDTR